jgi:enoyl-CoA hydratase/carnithine racemase
VGIVPGDGGAWSLQQIVGYSKAAELFLTGDTFDAEYARSIGLVSEVADDEALMDAAWRSPAASPPTPSARCA